MKTLGQLLGSTARTDVLHVLYCEPTPVGLRHIARVAGLHPRSVQLALSRLIDNKLVACSQTASRPLYRLNRDHPEAPVLEAVFQAAAGASIQRRCHSLQTRAQSILPFIDQAIRMLTTAREVPRVP